MALGMLAGNCRNVIIASVKQGEVKKPERAVLYLADYPHASSRLQGERADSLNRQEQAEHRQDKSLFAKITQIISRSQSQNTRFSPHYTQTFKQLIKH